MTRGVSTIEILIALALLATTLIAVTVLALGTPQVFANARAHHEAAAIGASYVSRELARGPEGFKEVQRRIGSTEGPYTVDTIVETLPGGLFKQVTATVSWISQRGVVRDSLTETIVTDYLNAPKGPCGAVLIGNWSDPASALVTGTALPPLSALSATRTRLVAASAKTLHAPDPAVFVFDISRASLRYRASYDATASSTVGYVATAMNSDLIYALSAETACPAETPLCARLDILSIADTLIERVATLPLPPAKSITYHDGRLYIGLRASMSTPELRIIDASDPLRPRQIGDAEIGDSISAIAVANGIAYLGTANNSAADKRALMAFDTREPHAGMSPFTQAWQGGAGVTQRIALSGNVLYLGRSSLNNSKELYLVSTEEIERAVASLDTESGMYGLVARSFMLFTLSRDTLESWQIDNAHAPMHISRVLNLPEHSVGADLICSGNHLYAASNTSDRGYLTVISGS